MSRTRNTSSSALAIGTATAFLVFASLAGFLAEDGTPVGTNWSLRGTLLPSAEAKPREG